MIVVLCRCGCFTCVMKSPCCAEPKYLDARMTEQCGDLVRVSAIRSQMVVPDQ
jgi:hypothetical protein